MTSLKSTLICLAFLVTSLSAHRAFAATLYTVRDADDRLIAIDNVTLGVTDVGPLGVPFEFGGLGYDPQSDTLYMIGGDINKALYRVSRSTGAATLIGSHGVSRLFGLDYDSKNGVLYASQYVGGSRLYTLNTQTGAANVVGDLGGNGLGGLAYDPTSDTLIGIEIFAGDLFSVNRSTAAKTLLFDGAFVGESSISSGLGNSSRITWKGFSKSFRSMPRLKPAQSLNSSPSNSCITTNGMKRLGWNESPPISATISSIIALSTVNAF